MAHKPILTPVQIQNTLSDLQNLPQDTPTSSQKPPLMPWDGYDFFWPSTYLNFGEDSVLSQQLAVGSGMSF